MSKYYMPDIEDLYVGFEHEIEVEGRWFLKIQLPDSLSVLYEMIKEDTIRVKYLDREDIESLGWEYFGYNNLTDLVEFRLDQFILSVGESENTISVYRKLLVQTKEKPEGFFSDDYLHQIYEGNIKNKSELKVLMKQLGIDGNN